MFSCHLYVHEAGKTKTKQCHVSYIWVLILDAWQQLQEGRERERERERERKRETSTITHYLKLVHHVWLTRPSTIVRRVGLSFCIFSSFSKAQATHRHLYRVSGSSRSSKTEILQLICESSPPPPRGRMVVARLWLDRTVSFDEVEVSGGRICVLSATGLEVGWEREEGWRSSAITSVSFSTL